MRARIKWWTRARAEKKRPKVAPTPQNPKMENLTYDYSGPHMARRVNAALKKQLKCQNNFIENLQEHAN